MDDEDYDVTADSEAGTVDIKEKKKRELRCKRTFDFEGMARKHPDEFKVSGEGGTVVRMGGVRFHRDHLTLAMAARDILERQGQMTLRGLYYALFGEGWIPNSQEVYKGLVIPAMVKARQYGIVPWDAIDDSTRTPSSVGMWRDVKKFMEAVKRSYTRDVWQDQEVYVEVWLEKRTGVAQAKEVCHEYGVTVNAGNGYDGWSSIHEAALRFDQRQRQGKKVHVLYIGDFDPSGLHMFFNLQERLAFFKANEMMQEMPTFHRLGVNDDDIEEHDLPEAPGKLSDSRSGWMQENYGKVVQVEMDALWALDTNVFQAKLRQNIEDLIDMEAFAETQRIERLEVKALGKAIEAMDLSFDDSGDETGDGDEDEDEEA